MTEAYLLEVPETFERYKDRLGRDRGHIGHPVRFPCLVLTAPWEERGETFWQHGFVYVEEAQSLCLTMLCIRSAERQKAREG
jgi:hypothetical protein